MRGIIAYCVFALFIHVGSSQEANGDQLEGLTGLDRIARMSATIHNPSDPKNPRVNRRFKQLYGFISKNCRYTHQESADKTVTVWQGIKKAGVRGESLLDTTEQIHNITSGLELAYRQYGKGKKLTSSVCQDAMIMYWSLREKGTSTGRAFVEITTLMTEILKSSNR